MSKIIQVWRHKACSDGLLSGFNAYVHFRSVNRLDWVAFHEVQYGETLPEVGKQHLYILDFSVPPEKFAELSKTALSITMLDHHKTAFDQYADVDLSQCGCLPTAKRKGFLSFANDRATEIQIDMDQSGCYMSYKHFCAVREDMGYSLPEHFLDNLKLLNLHIQDRDLWRFTFKETKAYYEMIQDPRYRNFEGLWDLLMKPTKDFLDVVAQYQMRVAMREEQAASIASKRREIAINGYAVAIVNCPSLLASETGSLLAEKFAAAIMYVVDIDHAILSIRSKEHSAVKAIEIASHFGGGGHDHSAGCKIKKDVFFDFYHKAQQDYNLTPENL